MNQITTHLFAFLVGIASGAASTYYAELFSDRRRAQESEKEINKRFRKIKTQMPDLILEMKEDLSSPTTNTKRDFFVIRKGAPLTTTDAVLVYYTDSHTNLKEKITILENHGYIIDITPGNAPKYRLQENFVELILNDENRA
jgi:hypothetical protein